MNREYHRLTVLNGQARTSNPNRVPSKAAGRVGTRRAWKRAHPPGWWDRLWAQAFDETIHDMMHAWLTGSTPPMIDTGILHSELNKDFRDAR